MQITNTRLTATGCPDSLTKAQPSPNCSYYYSTNYAQRGIFWTDGLDNVLGGRNLNAGLVLGPWDHGTTIGLRITHDGKVSIGVPETLLTDNNNVGYKLYVAGGIMTERCRVALKTSADWGDWVFDKNNTRMSFEEQFDYYMKNKHLKHIPSASEIKKGGIDVSDMFTGVVINLEEARLDNIALHKENQDQKTELEKLKSQMKKLQLQVEKLEKKK